jgi:hypothetical protein
VPDGEMPVERGEVGRAEDLRHEPHLAVHDGARPVGHGDAGRLLAAVLEREQREVGQRRDVLARRVDAEHAALAAWPLSEPCEIPVVRGPRVTGRSERTTLAAPHAPTSASSPSAAGSASTWADERIERQVGDAGDRHARRHRRCRVGPPEPGVRAALRRARRHAPARR